MSDEKNNEKNNVEPPSSGNRPVRKDPGRSPKAALVWLVIMLIIGGLFLFKGFGSAQTREISQSQFETMLKSRQIATAVLVSEGDKVFTVEGTLAAAPENSKEKPEKSKNTKVRPQQYRTRVVYTDALNELLGFTNVQINSNNAGVWNFVIFALLPVVIIVGMIYFFSARQMRMGGHGAMEFGKSRARMIPPDELNVRFDDIAGADEAKEEISEIVEFLKDPIRFQLIGGKIPRGCLLVGNPGTGKTLMAKAVACEAGVPFFSISGSDFVEMFVGVGASRVRDMFDQARKNTPCLIFIDEIDAVGRSRFSGWGGGHDEREQTLNAMLVEMDGLESRSGVIVLAATNRPDVLDPALLRPGRFDRQVVMDLPDIKGRRQILEVHAKKIKTDATVDLDVIARTTPGFSGADLANLCNEAALLAARRNKEAVGESEMEEARDKVSYGTERRSRKLTEHDRKLTAVHEAGHALVALYNEKCTPVHKVTIIPRGQAYLGATFTMPKEDVYSRSKGELIAEMAMTMGGRAAEELLMQDISTGASADIRHLSAVARQMVCVYGMSDKIGPWKCADMTVHPHLRIDGPTPEEISPETQKEIDLEIRALVNQALADARKCLTDHKEQLQKLADALLEKETMSVEEIRDLLDIPDPDKTVQSSETESAENSTTDA
ncbi:MAG: ATP-dependent zinc metalloprotease FtsH [Lentisphaeria bacterium]|nr:ATP-dependent zinc metalloprotease FtsH [Lentisphaeria bacterium]